MTTKSLSSSNGLPSNTSDHSDSHDTSPRQSVSQPAVMPTTCHVICWPPYMAWKRSIMTKYGSSRFVDQSRDITWRPGLRCSQAWRQCLFFICSMLPRTDHLWPTSVTVSEGGEGRTEIVCFEMVSKTSQWWTITDVLWQRVPRCGSTWAAEWKIMSRNCEYSWADFGDRQTNGGTDRHQLQRIKPWAAA